MGTSASGPTDRETVLVVGAGIAGLACARALQEAGVPVRVVDRGRRPGGRMSGRTLHGRVVDLGASYFTVPEGSPFGGVVDDWVRRGLARGWTDTFAVIDAARPAASDRDATSRADSGLDVDAAAHSDGVAHSDAVSDPDPTSDTDPSSDAHAASTPPLMPGRAAFRTTTGPLRYAAPGGLRSLVVDLAERLVEASGSSGGSGVSFAEVLGEHVVETVSAEAGAGAGADAGADAEAGAHVDSTRYRAVVLAMPEPQALRLLELDSELAGRLDPGAWQPTVAVALGYPERVWPAELHGAFVDGSDVLSFVADDGDRRGDHAPVLVAHTTAEFARAHLAEPAGAVEEVVAELQRVLDLPSGSRPDWTHPHRWTHARATPTHPEPFALCGAVGVCGDSWGGRSSVATAWASGDALGRAIAAGR